jgi:two-component system, OmpR family, alkaline phosphatase synthesis response regulator PhoP
VPHRTNAPTIRRILIIDDEESILAPLARYFRRIGCEPVTAQEREEAEALLEHEAFDLIILDLALSGCGLDGMEILRGIRASSYGTPVIVLSGLVTPEIESEALRRGADAVLPKPQALADLARVSAYLMRAGV